MSASRAVNDAIVLTKFCWLSGINKRTNTCQNTRNHLYDGSRYKKTCLQNHFLVCWHRHTYIQTYRHVENNTSFRYQTRMRLSIELGVAYTKLISWAGLAQVLATVLEISRDTLMCKLESKIRTLAIYFPNCPFWALALSKHCKVRRMVPYDIAGNDTNRCKWTSIVINDDDGSGDGHGGMIALHRTITDYK